MIEDLSFSIEGKLALWRALATAQERPEFQRLDLEPGEKGHGGQRERAETAHLEAARVALSKVVQ